ncbi:CBS domain-containing protein [Vibrio sp. M60_M31a]
MMTRHPHTLSKAHTLRDAKEMMEALDIRHIPVVDANTHLQGLAISARYSCGSRI